MSSNTILAEQVREVAQLRAEKEQLAARIKVITHPRSRLRGRREPEPGPGQRERVHIKSTTHRVLHVYVHLLARLYRIWVVLQLRRARTVWTGNATATLSWEQGLQGR